MAEVTREDVQGADEKTGDGDAPKPVFNPSAPPKDKEPEGQPSAPQSPPEAPSGAEKAPSGEGEPSAPDLDGFSFPDHESVPELLRGKKGSEAVRAYQTLFDTSKRMAAYMQQQQNQPAQPPAQPVQQAQQTEPLLTSDDFISGDPDVIEQKLGQLFERKAAPLLADIYKGMTIQTMHAAKSNLPHYSKYEQEILQELSQTPINQTANFNTWKDAHDRVVARHIDDIANERMKNRPTPPVTERGGGTAPQGSDVSGELTADDIKIADGLGVSREVFARMKGVYNARTGEVS